MSLSREDVERLAWLARLKLEREGLPEITKQISNILDFVNQMDAIDTEHVDPLSHPLELTARLREDTVTETNRRDQFQTAAPLVEDGLYLVPKVIE